MELTTTSDVGEQLRGLYRQHPSAQAYFEREFSHGTPEKSINTVACDPPKDLTIASLDAYEHDLDLCLVVSHLPPRLVLDTFGEDPLLWAWIRSPYGSIHNSLAPFISNKTNRDLDLLKKARLSLWEDYTRHDAATVLSHEEAMQKLRKGIVTPQDLESLLQKHTREGLTLSGKRLTDYRLDLFEPERNYTHGYEKTWGRCATIESGRGFAVYLDSPTALALMYRDRPQAVVGLTLEDPQTLLIKQMQGITEKVIDYDGKEIGSYSSRGLFPFQWQELLVGIAERAAQNLKLGTLGILGAHNNRWIKPQGGKIHMKFSEAEAKYDKVAKRLGFAQRKNKNWYRPVPNNP